MSLTPSFAEHDLSDQRGCYATLPEVRSSKCSTFGSITTSRGSIWWSTSGIGSGTGGVERCVSQDPSRKSAIHHQSRQAGGYSTLEEIVAEILQERETDRYVRSFLLVFLTLPLTDPVRR